MGQALHVVMYHYIRDLPRTPFPRIKAMPLSSFRQQLYVLQDRYEMATLESAMAFLSESYVPHRDLCLLTFDDGLKEHYTDVTPLLAEAGIQGMFFPITGCLQDTSVASVHMNHFLMAALDFETYQRAFLQRLEAMVGENDVSEMFEPAGAQRTYRWDTPAVASFKYLFNFVLDKGIRDRVVKTLFEAYIAEESTFSKTLYLNWEEARQMQDAGMLIGGHSHRHEPLAKLSAEEMAQDLTMCSRLLSDHLKPQQLRPFSYPYGKKDSFADTSAMKLKQLGFTCSFTTEPGVNSRGADEFTLCRLDCKDASLN